MRGPDARYSLSLDAPQRYWQFLDDAAQCREVWGLGDQDGWLHVRDVQDHVWYPIWSRRGLAEACAQGRWHHRTASAMALDEFVEVWLARSVSLGHGFLVYPTPVSAGVGISAYELQLALRNQAQALPSAG